MVAVQCYNDSAVIARPGVCLSSSTFDQGKMFPMLCCQWRGWCWLIGAFAFSASKNTSTYLHVGCVKYPKFENAKNIFKKIQKISQEIINPSVPSVPR